MDRIYEILETLIVNAKKSVYKPYTLDTVSAKKKEIYSLEVVAEKTLAEEETTDEIRESRIEKFNVLKKEALDILETHLNKQNKENLQDIETNSETEKTDTMSPVNLTASDLASYSKLLPVFNGAKEELDQFLANLEMVSETVPENKVESFFNFVFRTRLTIKVQNRVKQGTVPTTITLLKTELKKAYKVKKAPTTILNELTRITQTESIKKFSDKIENLITELNEIQISEVGEEGRNTIITANETIAFNAFKNGLKNREIARTIEASRTKSFAEAVEIAEETSSDMIQSQIMFQNVSQGNRKENWNKNSEKSEKANCKRCGRRHGERCPAEGKKCFACNGFNHFSKACFKNKNNRQGNGDSKHGYKSNQKKYYNGNRDKRVHHIEGQGNSRDPEVVDYQDTPEE